ncbi:hypothetical protein LTR94_032831, partial [Friedmanniomyces endolithicus]
PWRLGAGRAHRSPHLEGGDDAAAGNHAQDALRRAGRHPHGRDRPSFGQARLWRMARHRRQARDHLGSVQARIRTAPHHPQGRGGGAGQGRRRPRRPRRIGRPPPHRRRLPGRTGRDLL